MWHLALGGSVDARLGLMIAFFDVTVLLITILRVCRTCIREMTGPPVSADKGLKRFRYAAIPYKGPLAMRSICIRRRCIMNLILLIYFDSLRSLRTQTFQIIRLRISRCLFIHWKLEAGCQSKSATLITLRLSTPYSVLRNPVETDTRPAQENRRSVFPLTQSQIQQLPVPQESGQKEVSFSNTTTVLLNFSRASCQTIAWRLWKES